MLEEIMSFIRTCIMGGHVFCMTSLVGGHALWEVTYYGGTCLMRGHFVRRTCLTVKRHEVRNVFHDDISREANIWYLCRSCNRLYRCEFKQPLFIFLQKYFVFSETCFPRIYCFQCSFCVSKFIFNVCLVDA